MRDLQSGTGWQPHLPGVQAGSDSNPFWEIADAYKKAQILRFENNASNVTMHTLLRVFTALKAKVKFLIGSYLLDNNKKRHTPYKT